jgi:hypothetical protein
VFGVAFNGGFNQPIMCGGEPRQMTLQVRGKADPPIYTIRIRVPQHGWFWWSSFTILSESKLNVYVILIILALAIVVAAISLVFSFTNGTDWDGPYTLNFKVPKPWQDKPLSFFNEVCFCIFSLKRKKRS